MCFLLRSGGGLVEPLMHLCLHEVGLSTFHSCLDYHRAVIIEPTDLTVVFTSLTDQVQYGGGLQDLVAPRAALEIRTSKMRTHFSYTDSLLFLALLDSLREQTAYAFGGGSTTNSRANSPPPDVNDTSFGGSSSFLSLLLLLK